MPTDTERWATASGAGTATSRAKNDQIRAVDVVARAVQTVMGDLQGLKSGRITLATMSTAGAYVVPSLFGAFRAQHPGIVISLEVTIRATVLQRLPQNEDSWIPRKA